MTLAPAGEPDDRVVLRELVRRIAAREGIKLSEEAEDFLVELICANTTDAIKAAERVAGEYPADVVSAEDVRRGAPVGGRRRRGSGFQMGCGGVLAGGGLSQFVTSTSTNEFSAVSVALTVVLLTFGVGLMATSRA